MNFASARQIVLLVIIITAGCYIFDYYKNPQLWHHVTPTTTNVNKATRLPERRSQGTRGASRHRCGERRRSQAITYAGTS